MTKVSIIIPTRNRAHLLHFAIKSAIEQEYKDIEIIVCDNYSTNDTKETVKSFNNKNIIYIRTDKALSMPDNWEFALSQARGEYITFLTDDSYLLPNCIELAMKDMDKFNVRLAVWKHCGYFYPDWIEPGRRNVLHTPKTTYKSYLLNSKESLQKCYTNIRAHAYLMPRSMNSLCHRSIIEKVLSIQGRFFLPSCPDYSSGASMLLNIGKYVLIDQPLVVDGVTSLSIGPSVSFNFGKSIQNFLKESNWELDEIAFLGIPTASAAIAKSLENVRSFYLDSCPKLNVKNVLCEIADSLSKLETYGAKTNLNDYWQILNKYVAAQDNEIKLAVKKQKIISKLKWMAIKTIRFLPYLYYLETLRNVDILKGSKFKFNNIEEAAKIVGLRNRSKNLEE